MVVSRPCKIAPLFSLQFISTFDFMSPSIINGATFKTTHPYAKGFYDAIFELIGIIDLHAMVFDEFVNAVCTYSMFTVSDKESIEFYMF